MRSARKTKPRVTPTVSCRQPVAAQAEDASGARARRDLDADRPLERRDLGLAAQHRGGERDDHGGLEVVALPLELGMGQDVDLHVEVPAPAARWPGILEPTSSVRK